MGKKDKLHRKAVEARGRTALGKARNLELIVASLQEEVERLVGVVRKLAPAVNQHTVDLVTHEAFLDARFPGWDAEMRTLVEARAAALVGEAKENAEPPPEEAARLALAESIFRSAAERMAGRLAARFQAARGVAPEAPSPAAEAAPAEKLETPVEAAP